MNNEGYSVNKHIKRYLINEYKGSEQKDTIILDDNEKYLLKKPDPTREKNKKEILSYINNVYSEYIGCNIARLMGFEVQETKLGEYTTRNRNGEETTKIVCLCKDVRKKNEKMREFDTISLSSDMPTNVVTFEITEQIILNIQERLNLSEETTQEIRDFYYKLFILDAFIGNTDRHNGNIALLLNENDEFSRISPIYDCGSSLLPLIDDKEINSCNLQNLALSINSAIKTNNMKTIRYNDFLINNRNKNIDNALLEVICNIDLNKINEMINNTNYISDIRKYFYKSILELRYNKILIPALEKIFQEDNTKTLSVDKITLNNINLYEIYKRNIKLISDLDFFDKHTIICSSDFQANNITIDVMKISKKYALCIKNNKCIGLLPIRSNHNEIREAINFFNKIKFDIINENIQICDIDSEKLIDLDIER
jgi:hypothetical protein